MGTTIFAQRFFEIFSNGAASPEGACYAAAGVKKNFQKNILVFETIVHPFRDFYYTIFPFFTHYLCILSSEGTKFEYLLHK